VDIVGRVGQVDYEARTGVGIREWARGFKSCAEGTVPADSVVRPEPPGAKAEFVAGTRPRPRTSKTEVAANHVTISRCFMILTYGIRLTASICTFELKLT
jgi:hypothetical protein